MLSLYNGESNGESHGESNGKMENEMETGIRKVIIGVRVPKIRGPILGIPIIRTRIYWGLYWGPPI